MSVAFLLTSLLIVVTPGTGALLSISAGLSHGRRASAVTAFGCTLGVVPHLLAALLGAAALLRASGEAFETIKIAGVGYLLVLAVRSWRDRSPLVTTEGERRPAHRVIGAAVLANLLNPKLTLFFFTFLPLFVPTGTRHPLPLLLELSGVFMAMTLVVFLGYGAAAAALRRHVIERPGVVRTMRKFFAVSFVGLSAKLATTTAR